MVQSGHEFRRGAISAFFFCPFTSRLRVLELKRVLSVREWTAFEEVTARVVTEEEETGEGGKNNAYLEYTSDERWYES